MSRPVSVLLLVPLVWGCDPTQPVEAKRPKVAALVRVEKLELRQIRREIETTAFLESEHRVAVMPKVIGRIDEVLVDEGAMVKRGQTLARFDSREAASARRQV